MEIKQALNKQQQQQEQPHVLSRDHNHQPSDDRSTTRRTQRGHCWVCHLALSASGKLDKYLRKFIGDYLPYLYGYFPTFYQCIKNYRKIEKERVHNLAQLRRKQIACRKQVVESRHAKPSMSNKICKNKTCM